MSHLPTVEQLDLERRTLEKARLDHEWQVLHRERERFQAEHGMHVLFCATAQMADVSGVGQSIPIRPVGSRVQVYWSGDNLRYRGTISEARTQYHVIYDDGDSEWETEVEDIDDDDGAQEGVPALTLPFPFCAQSRYEIRLRIRRSSRIGVSKLRVWFALPQISATGRAPDDLTTLWRPDRTAI